MSDTETLEWLVWFARKSKGTVAEVTQRALDQNPYLLAAAPRSGEGLDVEVLAQAMRAVSDANPGNLIVGYRLSGPDENEIYEAIATEYARLRDELAAALAPVSTGEGLDEAYRRGFTDGRGEPPERGTVTQCPIEGVHEHAFRGPHGFREWLGAFPSEPPTP